MAFSSTLSGETVFGNKRVKYGTFATTLGTSTGDIKTGLANCESFIVQVTGSLTTTVVANETFPVAGGEITILCSPDAVGVWEAKGN